MHAVRHELPLSLDEGSLLSREATWGPVHVVFQSLPAKWTDAGLFADAADGQCPCPHWGYMLRGTMRIIYADHDELVHAGAAYYIPPGHTIRAVTVCELVEFSAEDAYQAALALAARAMDAGAGGAAAIPAGDTATLVH
jgi:hypothetical protein